MLIAIWWCATAVTSYYIYTFKPEVRVFFYIYIKLCYLQAKTQKTSVFGNFPGSDAFYIAKMGFPERKDGATVATVGFSTCYRL